MEFDLDKALEEVPIHVEDPPPPDRTSPCHGDLPVPAPAPLDSRPLCLGDLPTVEHKTLEHRTKLRPKPKKRTKPSRPAVRSHRLSEIACRYTSYHLQQNLSSARLFCLLCFILICPSLSVSHRPPLHLPLHLTTQSRTRWRSWTRVWRSSSPRKSLN